MNNKKILIFHTALAPYRVDFFNRLSNDFNCSFYFYRKNLLSQKYDQEKLKKQIKFTPKYLYGFDIQKRPVRFGILYILFKTKPKIILINEYGFIPFLVALYKYLFRLKFQVYTISDDSLPVAINRKGIRNLFRTFILSKINGATLISDLVKNWYIENFQQCKYCVLPILQDEIRIKKILLDSISISKEYIKYYNLNSKKILLFIGRLDPVKNLPGLLDAFSNISQENIKLIIVGSGEQKHLLEEIVKTKKINENILFISWVEGNELIAWYNIGQLFILPSISERFGAVVNEALIAGIPVLCSDLAGASSLIKKGFNGSIFNPYNKNELINLLLKYLKDIKPLNFDDLEVKPSLMNISFEEVYLNFKQFID